MSEHGLDRERLRRLIEENQEALRILAGETSQGGATRDDQQEQHAGLQIPDNPRMKRAGEPEMPGGESGVPAPAKNLAREGSRPGRPVSASGDTDQANASTEDARLADSVPIVPVPEWAIGERWLIWLCSDPECGAYTVDGSKEGCICHVDPVATVEIEVAPASEADRLRAEAEFNDKMAKEAEEANAKFAAENDRYREALERIAQPMPSDYPGPDNWATARGIARAALGEMERKIAEGNEDG